jgi:HSP20 family molecular chaperone IbpA
MKCPRCKRDVEKGWEYCSSCGFMLKNDDFSRFDDMFKRVNKQMEQMNRMFDKDFEVFDLSPVFNELREKPVERKARGFRITMNSGTGREPKVSVQTFGDSNNEMRKDILEQLADKGAKPSAKSDGKRHTMFRIPGLTRTNERPKQGSMERDENNEFHLSTKTEEPKTSVKRLGSKVVVDIEIPDVKSHDRIDVRELESSVEVKAIAGDKSYFKILTKPSQFKLSEKRFEKGMLHLEFS